MTTCTNTFTYNDNKFTNYSPETWIPTVRSLSPSNSTNKILCQVPSVILPSQMGTVTDCPNSIAIKWLCAFNGSCALHSSTVPFHRSSSGGNLTCKSLCKYGYKGGTNFSKNCLASSTNLSSYSFIVTAVVVWREWTIIWPFLIPRFEIISLQMLFKSVKAMPFCVFPNSTVS